MRTAVDEHVVKERPTMEQIAESLGKVFDTSPVKSTRQRSSRRRR